MAHTALVKSNPAYDGESRDLGAVIFADGDRDKDDLEVIAAYGMMKDVIEQGQITKMSEFVSKGMGVAGMRVWNWAGEERGSLRARLNSAYAARKAAVPEPAKVEKTGVLSEEDADVDLADGTISKIDDEQRNVFGWAYVTHNTDGQVNIDKSGDFIDQIEEIEKSAYNYVLKSREGDDMHTNVKTSTMIESMVFTPEKIEKMGIAPGTVPLGWWIGFHIEEDAVWERVKKGELRAFSIHGSGTRSKVDPDE